ncbi:MAG: DNA-binding response regulator [Bacilli bacterium]|nr:DNA-binding response regulator [Bacilli bacterium]
MLEFVVCDDEKEILKKVKGYIAEVMCDYSYKYNVITFDDYDNKFKEYVSLNKKGVVYILDVDMPSESGISIAKYIRNKDRESIIIIITSHHEAADEIYKGRLNILTFVSKYDRCEDSMKLAIKDSIVYLIEDKDLVVFTDMGNKYTIPAKDILYITKDGRKTVIKTDYEDHEVYTSLDKMKEYLPSYFKQSHRACIVNMNRVTKKAISKRIIHFDNGEEIDLVSDKYKKELVS